MNKKKIIGVSISIILIIALFIAMVCTLYIPFGEDEVFAEVASIQTNTNYWFNDSISSLYGYNGSANSVGAKFYNSDNTYFDGLNITYNSITTKSNNSGYSTISFEYTGSPYRRISIAYTRSTMLLYSIKYVYGNTTLSINREDIHFQFTTVPTGGDAYYVNEMLKKTLTTTAPVTDLTPDIHEFYEGISTIPGTLENGVPPLIGYENDFKTLYTVSLLNYTTFEDYMDNNGNINLQIGFFYSDDTLIIEFPIQFIQDTIEFENSNYETLYTCIPLIYNEYFENTLQGVSYCAIYALNHETEKAVLDYEAILDNYDITQRWYLAGSNNAYQQGYSIGYEAGVNADKTLLSVMWETFKFPFKLLFGEYDTDTNSATYGEYVNGLFTFTILGVDMRVFVVGLFSMAIIISIIRWII